MLYLLKAFKLLIYIVACGCENIVRVYFLGIGLCH